MLSRAKNNEQSLFTCHSTVKLGRTKIKIRKTCQLNGTLREIFYGLSKINDFLLVLSRWRKITNCECGMSGTTNFSSWVSKKVVRWSPFCHFLPTVFVHHDALATETLFRSMLGRYIAMSSREMPRACTTHTCHYTFQQTKLFDTQSTKMPNTQQGNGFAALKSQTALNMITRKQTPETNHSRSVN